MRQGEDAVKKGASECFICDETTKCKRFKFYSGVKKGGSTTRMLSCTVTVFEQWDELTMHEIEVCRECQLDLWRRKQMFPLIFFAAAAGAAFVIGVPSLLFLSWPMQVAVPAVFGLVALVMLGFAGYYLWKYFGVKPSPSDVAPLVIRATMDRLGEPGHTFMTGDQFVERHQSGMI